MATTQREKNRPPHKKGEDHGKHAPSRHGEEGGHHRGAHHGTHHGEEAPPAIAPEPEFPPAIRPPSEELSSEDEAE